MKNKLTFPLGNDKNINMSIDLDSEKSNCLFITGAGVSVGSGLPTYYGENGTYTNLKGQSPEQVINQNNMDKAPHKIWDVITPLLKKGMEAEPSLSHHKIVEIENCCSNSLIYTQNVDMLHKKAGSKNIVPIHGEAEFSYCRNCHNIFGEKQSYIKTTLLLDTFEKGECPKCPKCKYKKVRPNIVPFYGNIDEKLYNKTIDFVKDNEITICFVIGTQGIFNYINDPLYDIRSFYPKCIIIDINPDTNYLNSFADFNVKMNSDDFFNAVTIQEVDHL